MKQLLILGWVLALGALEVKGQGLINGNNALSGVSITIQDSVGVLNGGAKTVIGTPATAAGFSGAGPGEVLLALYGAADGTPLNTLLTLPNLIVITNNSTSTSVMLQGAVSLGNNYVLPTKPGFDGSQPLEFIFYGQDASGDYEGLSTEATGIVPGVAPTGVGTQIFGTAPGKINSFNLILEGPEPSTFAIAGVGAAMLALFRRKK